MLQSPVVAELLPKAAIREEPEATSLNQTLLKQYPEEIFGRDAALELIEDILAARVGIYLLAAPENGELLARRLSSIHFVLLQ